MSSCSARCGGINPVIMDKFWTQIICLVKLIDIFSSYYEKR